MYCYKCGKEIPNYSTKKICDECEKAEVSYCHKCGAIMYGAQGKTYCDKCEREQYIPKHNHKMDGFKSALFGFLISIVALILVTSCLVLEDTMLASLADGKIINLIAPITIILFNSLPFIVVCLINAFKAINQFKTNKHNKLPKPIATLVFGIANIVIDGLSVTYWMFALIIYFVSFSIRL